MAQTDKKTFRDILVNHRIACHENEKKKVKQVRTDGLNNENQKQLMITNVCEKQKGKKLAHYNYVLILLL